MESTNVTNIHTPNIFNFLTIMTNYDYYETPNIMNIVNINHRFDMLNTFLNMLKCLNC